MRQTGTISLCISIQINRSQLNTRTHSYGLESDYKLRGKWNKKTNSNVKPVREYFGNWRAVDVTSDAVSKYIEDLLEQKYSAATCNRRTQLLGQARAGF